MSLGYNLFQARRRMGLSQETVSEKLGVSRQTISKWETDETIPDIYQAKKLSQIYNLSLDELIEFDIDLKNIEDAINRTNDEVVSKINWTNAWSKKYPILATYPQRVDIPKYSSMIRDMLNSLKRDYNLNDLDSMLVLKDILYHEWKDKK